MIADVVSLSSYEFQVRTLLTEDERMAMEFFIACAPDAHPVIPGTGGFRKARWARSGGGKSGGFRTIFFFVAEPGRIYLAMIYPKSQRANLSASDRAVLATLSAAIKSESRGSR